MTFPHIRMVSRRRLVIGGTAILGSVQVSTALAALLPTPEQTEGPFYPVEMPADIDEDLVKVKGADTRALGDVTHLTGRVLDGDGRPLRGMMVEIWQCDANGNYLHPRSGGSGPRDPRFQGYGRTLTDASGGYHFRTIKPVPYTGRTPHIHVKVVGKRGELLTTQMYVKGEPRNERDFLFGRLSRDERERVAVELVPADAIESGALSGTFDIIVET